MAGLYIHIPFCRSRCIYCAFYSTTLSDEWQDRYVDALCREMDLRSTISEDIATIYLGGGTPSLLSEANLLKLFTHINEVYGLDHVQEVTIECNPDDITDAFCHTLQLLPVNRVSLGAQTFDAERLRFLQRRHTALQVNEAIDRLRQNRIDNISLDLMFGFPEQTTAQWSADIDHALALRPEHISAYSLMIEEGTPLFKRIEKGELRIGKNAEETSRQMYELLTDRLANAGYEHYEISNWSLPGHRSRHNSSYWNDTPYIGLGAAAHSYDLKTRSWNTADLRSYVEAINLGQRPCESEEIDEVTHYNDIITTSLRTRKGLHFSAVPERFRGYLLNSAQRSIQSGLLEKNIFADDTVLRLTREGLFVSDDVMSDLIFVDE